MTSAAVRARALPAQSVLGGGIGRGAKPPSEQMGDGARKVVALARGASR
jgi:hypothetical protein